LATAYEPPKPPPLSKRRLSERQQIYLLSHPELLEKLLAEKEENEEAKATGTLQHVRWDDWDGG